jgi:hypothetical protein
VLPPLSRFNRADKTALNVATQSASVGLVSATAMVTTTAAAAALTTQQTVKGVFDLRRRHIKCTYVYVPASCR